ncbi:MAG: efflux RND transporter periplasmic adaptor subunit [Acidobacteriota bacterium]
MRNFFIGFILAGVLVSGGYWIISRQNAAQSPATSQKVQKYHCPMHPEYISDKPGDCPICGMKLVPMESQASPEMAPKGEHAGQESSAAPAKKERKILYWTNAMNPGTRYDKPGKAPYGMDLVPVYEEESPAAAGQGVPGYAPVKIPPERLQMMGVTTEKARVMSLDQSIRTVGTIAPDETRISHIHTKFEGYIEQIYVNFIGQQVSAGQPLFSVYSSELLATQKEYLLALQVRDQWEKSGTGARLPGVNLVEAAKQRLTLWDISPDQIAQVEKTREPIRALMVYSPVSGIVSAKTAVQGNRVMPADTLYEITDLSSVWVQADLYEINVPFVKIGDPATISLSYDPGRIFRGRVSYINPSVDEKSRTVKVRIVLENPSGMLKPDMYADVVFGGQLGYGVAVPDSAVMGTGEREMVFVAKGDGLFEPREVKTGVKVRGFYEIKKGVAAGENVVTGANFLLDSESKLKAAISGAGK